MKCEAYVELLSASLDGELTPEEQAQLDAHLESCPHCRALHAELSGLQDSFDWEVTPPPELKPRILDALPPQRSAANAPYWRRWGAMAAAVALVALAAWQLPKFIYDAPKSVSEAADLLAGDDEAVTADQSEAPMGTYAAPNKDMALDNGQPVSATGALSDHFGSAAVTDQAAPKQAAQEHVEGETGEAPAAAETFSADDPGDPVDSDDAPAVLNTSVTADTAAPLAAAAPAESPTPQPRNYKMADSLDSAAVSSGAGETNGATETGGTDKTGDLSKAVITGEVLESAPEVGLFDYAAQDREAVSEGPWDFSCYSAVVTWPNADLSGDYPWQIQENGDTWYLIPSSLLTQTLQATDEGAPAYEVRAQGEDLTADAPYVLVIVPAAP